MCHVVGRDRTIGTPLNTDKPHKYEPVLVMKLFFLNKYMMEDE